MNRTFMHIVAITIMAIAVPVLARLLWADGVGTNQNPLVRTEYGYPSHTFLASLSPCINYITAAQAPRSVWNYATDLVGILLTYGLAILTVLVFAETVWVMTLAVQRKVVRTHL